MKTIIRLLPFRVKLLLLYDLLIQPPPQEVGVARVVGRGKRDPRPPHEPHEARGAILPRDPGVYREL